GDGERSGGGGDGQGLPVAVRRRPAAGDRGQHQPGRGRARDRPHRPARLGGARLVPSYQYKAIDKAGRPARGGVDAVNEVDLELRLRRMSLDLITYKEVERLAAPVFTRRDQINRTDLVDFCFDIEHVVRHRIPIIYR